MIKKVFSQQRQWNFCLRLSSSLPHQRLGAVHKEKREKNYHYPWGTDHSDCIERAQLLVTRAKFCSLSLCEFLLSGTYGMVCSTSCIVTTSARPSLTFPYATPPNSSSWPYMLKGFLTAFLFHRSVQNIPLVPLNYYNLADLWLWPLTLTTTVMWVYFHKLLGFLS